MAKKALLVVFTLECLVLSVLLAREWTLFYVNGGTAEREYARVYSDKIDAGHHAVTAEIDASTTSFVFWWGGVVCLFVGVGFGVPCWAYQQLWPDAAAFQAGGIAPPPWEEVQEMGYAGDADVAADMDDLFGDEYDGVGAM